MMLHVATKYFAYAAMSGTTIAISRIVGLYMDLPRLDAPSSVGWLALFVLTGSLYAVGFGMSSLNLGSAHVAAVYTACFGLILIMNKPLGTAVRADLRDALHRDAKIAEAFT